MEIKKRTAYPLGMFDLMKGLGMIQIVMFHTKYMFDISPWIYYLLHATGAGLMGMYYAINGFQFRPVDAVSAALKKYAKTYLPSYLRLAIYVILGLVFLCLPFISLTTPSVLYGYVLGFLLGTLEAIELGSLSVENAVFGWFFLALFWGSILLNLTLKIKNQKTRMLSVIAMGIIGVYLEWLCFGYYCICRGFQAVPTMYLGYSLQKEFAEDTKATNVRYIPYVLLAVAWFICGYLECPAVPSWAYIVMRPILEMMCGYAYIYIARDTMFLSNSILEFIRKIGRYSPWIIIIHSLEHVCIPWYFLFPDPAANPNRSFVLLFLCRSTVIFLCCILMNKITRWERQIKRKYFRKKGRKKSLA